MTGSEPNYRNSRLFRGASGQDELFETPYEEERENLRGELVECLGLAFENEETRRSHFLGRLREGWRNCKQSSAGFRTEVSTMPWREWQPLSTGHGR